MESERFWRDLSAEFLELHGTAPALYAVFDSSTPAEIAALVAAAGTKATKAITRATAIHRALSALSESVADADHRAHRNRALRVHRAEERAHRLEEHAYHHARYAARGGIALLAGQYDRGLWVIGEGTQVCDTFPGVSERRFRPLAERAATGAGAVESSSSAEQAVQAWLHLLNRQLEQDRSPFVTFHPHIIERLCEASALLCGRFATDAYRLGLAPNAQKLEADSPTAVAAHQVVVAAAESTSEESSNIVRNLNILKDRCGWTLDVLVASVRVDRTNVSKHLNGHSRPRPGNRKQYAAIFSEELGCDLVAGDLDLPPTDLDRRIADTRRSRRQNTVKTPPKHP